MNCEQGHDTRHKRQYRHRRAEHQQQNDRDEDDCGKNSLEQFQLGSAPQGARSMGFVQSAVTAIALLIVSDAFEQVNATELRP